MRVELSAYSAFKPCYLEWLGQLPSHWELRRLKYLGEAITGLTYSPDDVVDEDNGTLVLRSSNVQGGRIVFDDNVFVSMAIAQKLMTRSGDILICSRNGSRALIGKNAVIDELSEGQTFGAFMTVFRSEHSDYIACVLNSPLFEFQSGAFMTSTINQLTLGTLNNFEVPWPPAEDRAAIVTFLDRETAKIDRLMAVRQKQVDCLQEQRTAVIHHAVTRGLDPHAKMKPSGVEWLGDVNSDWNNFDIKHLAEVMAGGTPKSSEYEYWDGDVVWVTPTDLGKGSTRYVNASSRMITPLGQTAAGLALLPATSLVMSTRAPVGSMSILGVPATTNQGCKGMVFDGRQADSRFFYYLLSLAIPFLNAVAQGATFVELSGFQLKNVKIACPEVDTQKQISDWLDDEMKRFDELFAKYRSELELLAEYRASLISHAVTGKIDVRGLVEPSPTDTP